MTHKQNSANVLVYLSKNSKMTSPEHQRLTPSAYIAAEQYLRSGQDGFVDRQILENFDQIADDSYEILDRHTDGQWKGVPLAFVKANMLRDLARQEVDPSARAAYRDAGAKLLHELSESTEVNPDIKISSRMGLIDEAYRMIYDRFYDDESLEFEIFSKQWDQLHQRSLDSFMKTLVEVESLSSEDDLDANLGILFEWFWVNTRRNRQQRIGAQDRYLIRTTLAREDMGSNTFRNIDAVYDSRSDNGWRKNHLIQLKLRSGKLSKSVQSGTSDAFEVELIQGGQTRAGKYDDDIVVMQYTFKSTEETYKFMKEMTGAMRGRIALDRIGHELDHQQRQDQQRVTDFAEAGVSFIEAA